MKVVPDTAPRQIAANGVQGQIMGPILWMRAKFPVKLGNTVDGVTVLNISGVRYSVGDHIVVAGEPSLIMAAMLMPMLGGPPVLAYRLMITPPEVLRVLDMQDYMFRDEYGVWSAKPPRG
jgi:hypothetical protein